MKRVLSVAALTLLLLIVALAITLRVRYGGATTPFPDRTTAPMFTNLEVVATLPEPPGNIAVTNDGRVFFTYHPEARPELHLLELVNGKPVPYPSAEFQERFVTPLSVRADRQGRLWVLDIGFHGIRGARLLAFDLRDGRLVHESPELAGFGSFVQDFQLDPEARRIYLADLSILAKHPALLIYDTQTRGVQRVLEGHPSVSDHPYRIVARGTPMEFLGGLYKMHPALDSIALDRNGEWLYYGAMSNDTLYRLRTRDLHVEAYGPKPQTDGIAIDDAGNIYMAEVEHGTLAFLGADRKLRTLVRDDRLRWPDGLGFGPDGSLYVTDSALQHVILKSRANVAKHAPYFIFRVRAASSSPAPR